MQQTSYGPPIESVEKLYAAIQAQNYSHVRAILDERIVTLRDRNPINGNTALHVAVGTSKNREFLVKMLDLAREDNQQALDMRNFEGSTLLHVAAIDNEGKTSLVRAILNMETDTIIYLLDHYSVTPHLENGELFDGTHIVVNAISSKDYVKSFVCPLNVIQKNSFGETPQMLFTKEHKKLLIEGEKWMKEIAQTSPVLARTTVESHHFQNHRNLEDKKRSELEEMKTQLLAVEVKEPPHSSHGSEQPSLPPLYSHRSKTLTTSGNG
ncbi:hypothetical protein E3N88_09578 [Mikania micrantha]|uniref:Uncharacterized protein n=1 Tax=Mikania micrantha TaxID=192012 RepID=A0A5N6PK52_9ASTR|nr:hypothetical protein E3N88_09578 [Mikania micrantha]